MEFAHPTYLGFTAAAVILTATLLVFGLRRRRQRLGNFAAPALVGVLTQSLSRPKHMLKAVLLLVGLASVGVALAQPRLGSDWEKVERKGIDLMFAVDVSRSMLAEDVTPDRLSRAKLAVEDLVDAFDGDRVGLVAFAADAFLQCPLTLDRDVFHRGLGALDPSLMSRGGSDLAAAIETARSAASSEEGHEKLLVLITDGEDLGGEALAAAGRAAKDGLKIYTVGVGDPKGALIPLSGQTQSYLRDAKGDLVRTRLDEATLRRMAELTGGAYAALGSDGQGLRRMYEQHLASLPQRAVSSRMRRIPIERFMWPLGLALLLLLVEPLLTTRRKHVAAGWSLGLVFVLSVSSPAHAADSSAVQLYDEGRFAEAEAEWANRLAGATVQTQGTLYYHRGNARYRQGEVTTEEEIEQRRRLWQSALTDYRAALALDPNDEDAAFNYVFVAKRLEELNQTNPPREDDKSSCDNPQDDESEQNQDGSDQNESQGSDDQAEGQTPADSDTNQGADPNEGTGNAASQAEAQSQPGAAPPAPQAESQKKAGPGQKESDEQNSPGAEGKADENAAQSNLRLTPEQAARLLKSVDAHAEGGVLLVPAGRSAKPEKQDEEKNW